MATCSITSYSCPALVGNDLDDSKEAPPVGVLDALYMNGRLLSLTASLNKVLQAYIPDGWMSNAEPVAAPPAGRRRLHLHLSRRATRESAADIAANTVSITQTAALLCLLVTVQCLRLAARTIVTLGTTAAKSMRLLGFMFNMAREKVVPAGAEPAVWRRMREETRGNQGTLRTPEAKIFHLGSWEDEEEFDEELESLSMSFFSGM